MTTSEREGLAERLAAVWSAALFGPDQFVEVRAVGVSERYGRPSTWAGFFDPGGRVKLAEAAIRLTEKSQGVYFTLNPIDPGLLARRCNRVAKADAGELSKDKDVLRRRWLLVDADPVRVAGVSATDAEKEQARALALAARDHLRGRGWPDPILTDSGNGYHLLYRIDLPADDNGLLARALAALAGRFDTELATIDQTVHNPGRICKLPYTWARKGDNTPDRPHRLSRFLEVPPTGPVPDRASDGAAGWCVRVVPTELLTELASESPAPATSPGPLQPSTTAGARDGHYRHRLLVDRWLTDRGVSFRVKPQPDDKGRMVYALVSCPFDPAHGPDAAVMQAPDGKLSAHCFHNGCSGRGWQAFKDRIGKPDPRHYDPPMTGRGRNPTLLQPGAATGSRRPVEITTEEYRVNRTVAEELAKEELIFQRNGELVRVVVPMPDADGPRLSSVPRIEAVPVAALRDLISRRVEFLKLTISEGGEYLEPKHPPVWCVNAVAALGDWPGVRHLVGVVSFPALRPDGSILTAAGYDPRTGLFLHWTGNPLPVPTSPCREDAHRAAAELLDVVSDFPFQQEMHKAAWLAALLTPLARPAFDGPAPLFLVDANVRAAGKGMLLEVISRIVTGNPFPVISYPAGSKDGEEELRKKITTLLMYGDRLALFDNLTGGFGDGTLDRCLTSAEWQDRQLGSNRQFRGRVDVTFYATGNNVAIRADTARRVCHLRLESPEERPEERSDIRRPNLVGWVIDNRDRLLAAALTILRAYHEAGRPDHGLKPWGSFESWSRLVRNALVWCGLPDPGETRQVVQEQADDTGRGLRALIRALDLIDPGRNGLTAAEIVGAASDQKSTHSAEVKEMLMGAFDMLIAKPDGRKLGYKLRHLRRRVVEGRFIDLAGQDGGANRWVVKSSREFSSRGEACPPSPACPSPGPDRAKDMEDIEDMWAGECGPAPEKATGRRGPSRLFDDQRLPD
jgi:hypothetical protein